LSQPEVRAVATTKAFMDICINTQRGGGGAIAAETAVNAHQGKAPGNFVLLVPPDVANMGAKTLVLSGLWPSLYLGDVSWRGWIIGEKLYSDALAQRYGAFILVGTVNTTNGPYTICSSGGMGAYASHLLIAMEMIAQRKSDRYGDYAISSTEQTRWHYWDEANTGSVVVAYGVTEPGGAQAGSPDLSTLVIVTRSF
jgi:hypothetical protein